MSDSPDVLVIGAGPAGISAACGAASAGARVLLVDRDDRVGGILQQCVHDGFGLEMFGESLTGPEFVARSAKRLEAHEVEVMLGASVLGLGEHAECRTLSREGYRMLLPTAVVLATGCAERPFGALAVPGSRPAGIWSAGSAQRLVNVDGVEVGRKAVVLGSGDVGLIMSRRLTLEGAEVVCVVERMRYPGGLPRNVVQCLNDFDIPLLLSHTIVEVQGEGRLSAVVINQVDACGQPIAGTERLVECDTLLVAVGLRPENELAAAAGVELDAESGGPTVDQRTMTSTPGIFACGNLLYVHDLADSASSEGEAAGEAAAQWAAGDYASEETANVVHSEGIRYSVPQRLVPALPSTVSFRVSEPVRRRSVHVLVDGESLVTKDFSYLAPPELASIDVPALPAGARLVEVRLV